VLGELYIERAKEHLRAAMRQVLETLCTYLETRHEPIDYAPFRQEELPIGSGFLESACK
jgi:hypothetical protein